MEGEVGRFRRQVDGAVFLALIEQGHQGSETSEKEDEDSYQEGSLEDHRFEIERRIPIWIFDLNPFVLCARMLRSDRCNKSLKYSPLSSNSKSGFP